MASTLRSSLRCSAASLFRPSVLSCASLQQRRSLTVEAATIEDLEGEHRKEAWIYVDTVFPIRFGSLDPRILLSHLWRDSALTRLRHSIPINEPEALAAQLKIEDVVPREKDGGAFARVSYDQMDAEQGGRSAARFEGWLKERLDKTLPSVKPWWLVGSSQVHLVKGKPWLEDMDRYPNHTLKLDFENGSAPSQELLYDLLRPYGRIKDIIPDGKSVTVIYNSHRSACAARNCLDNFTFGDESSSGPTLHILFVQRATRHSIWNWITSHPRIVLPVLAVLFGSLSFFVFDPLRSFFVASKVSHRFDLGYAKALSWLRKETLGHLGLGGSADGDGENAARSGIEKERDAARHSLQGWLADWPESFIVISGPRGSGKGQLLDQVLAPQPHVLTVDCAAISKKENNDKMIAELAKQFGYFPLFGWLNSLNNMIDLASVGLIGSKAGFSTSPEAQIKNVLDVVTDALTKLSSQAKAKQAAAVQRADRLRERKEQRQEDRQILREEGLKDGRLDTLAGNGAMAELGRGVEREDGLQSLIVAGPGSKAEAKDLLQSDDRTTSMPVGDGLPVIVLRDFNASQGQSKEQLWDALAEFGSALVENKIAHVIVTSDNILVSKPLEKAMPSKPLNSIYLADSSAASSIEFVRARLQEYGLPDVVKPDNEQEITLLGGRLSDLEVLLQKLRSGFTLESAVEDIITRATSEAKKSIFGQTADESKAKVWSSAQAWYLTKLFAKQEEASYEDVLINGPFAGDEKPLRALEQAGIVAVVHRDGQTSTIRPGRPVWRAAFRSLTEDQVFVALQELALLSKTAASAQSTIKSASDELIALSTLFGGGNPGRWVFTGSSHIPVEMAARVEGLLAQIGEAQGKLRAAAEEEPKLKAVLKGHEGHGHS